MGGSSSGTISDPVSDSGLSSMAAITPTTLNKNEFSRSPELGASALLSLLSPGPSLGFHYVNRKALISGSPQLQISRPM